MCDEMMEKKQEFCRTRNVIAITNRKLCDRPFEEQIRRVCSLHPKAVILREKDLTEEAYRECAKRVKVICDFYKVPCIFHTFWNVAMAEGADLLHLPFPLLQEIWQSKNHAVLNSFQKIGTSVHSVTEAQQAEQIGVSYLTAGHIYATDCKKGLPPRGIDFLKEVCDAVSLPVYGIGGIKFDENQWDELEHAGAAGGCIMSGMMKI